MEYEIEVYSALCECETFTINNIEARYEDFVDKYDHCPEEAEPYGCGCMSCDIKPTKEEILKKYNITGEEYIQIAEELSEKLHFGCCGWCI